MVRVPARSDRAGRRRRAVWTASLQPEDVAALLIAAIKGVSMPTMGSFRPERIDQTFDQLERWLGLTETTAAESQGG